MTKGPFCSVRRAAALVLLSVGLSTSGSTARAQPPQDRLRLEVNRTNGLVTLNAQNVPLSSILERLEGAGIEVVAPEVEDRRVSVSLTNQPLPVVLARIFPPGTRYSIRGGREEIVIPGSSGDKPGRIAPRPTDKPRKGTTTPLPPLNPGGARKARPEVEEPEIKPPPEGSKAPPRLRELPTRTGPKLPKHQRVDGRYARLRLTMTSGGPITLQDALVLESEYVPDVGLLGEYVYALESGGRLLAVGSFRDPLERHSFYKETDKPHGLLTGKSGDFHVSLPGSVLDPRVLGGARLVIYRLVGAPPSPDLTLETFPKFRDALRPVQAIEGQELARSLSLSTPD